MLADAVVYRAHFDRAWFEHLDSVDNDLTRVAEDFLDRDRIDAVYEESAYATALVVIHYVEVREDARGRKLSHELVRTAARVFGNDIIALRPSSVSASPDGELVNDEIKQHGLTRHWRQMGFVSIPGTDTMMLPLAARE